MKRTRRVLYTKVTISFSFTSTFPPLNPANACQAMEKQKKWEELVEHFIEHMLQEAPVACENILREVKKELAELAD
jgi:hypothetical protein